jgi:deoxyinosine 3'endonuclease (endonuclease V)
MSNCSPPVNEREMSSEEATDYTTSDGFSVRDERLVSTWLQEQAEIAARVRVEPDPKDPPPGHQRLGRRFSLVPNRSLIPPKYHLFGGVDVSFAASDSNHDGPTDVSESIVAKIVDPPNSQPSTASGAPVAVAVAVYVVWDSRTGSVAFQDHEIFTLRVPYVPSFLAFREIDPLVRLVQKQRQRQPGLTPHVILVDGNGVLHPRRAGIACFLGVRTGLPTIGVGKSLYNEGGLTKEAVMNALAGATEAAADAIQTIFHDGAVTTNGPSNVIYDSRPARGRQSQTREHDKEHATIDARDEPRSGQAVGDRAAALSTLAAHCQGLAVPLGCLEPNSNANFPAAPSFLDPDPLPSMRVLACALVGHGGRNGKRTTVGGEESKRTVGSAKPIFVSVGHGVSLSSAVAMCASLSLSRIPEPIRQADLIGRELIRQQQRSGGTPAA